MSYELSKKVNRRGFEWELIDQGDDDKFYQCRGEVIYDDEHDQIPEPALWAAAHELSAMLLNNGVHSNVSHSEKGWVEVNIVNRSK